MPDLFPMMFHPTLVVDDLEDAAVWFRRVFGRTEVRWEEKWDLSLLNPDYPINYSYFYVIGDVSLDVLCPSLLVLPGEGAAVYPKGEGLADIAWFTDDIEGVSKQLEQAGFRTRDQRGTVIQGGAVPESALVADCPMIWSLPEDTGLTYEFYQMGLRHHARYSERADPRLRPDWQPDVVVEGDPLGIVRSARHTVLTLDPARATRLYVDVLDGTVLGTGYDPTIDADYTDISYAKSTLRFGTPRSGRLTDVLSGEATEADQFVGITFDVVDLDRVAAHLEAQGVPFTRGETGITTDPATSRGAVWGFEAAA